MCVSPNNLLSIFIELVRQHHDACFSKLDVVPCTDPADFDLWVKKQLAMVSTWPTIVDDQAYHKIRAFLPGSNFYGLAERAAKVPVGVGPGACSPPVRSHVADVSRRANVFHVSLGRRGHARA